MGLLNDLQVKAAAPRDKEYMLSDGEGLYLRVRSSGKAWLYRYQQDGKPRKLSLGGYPAVSLAAARKKARAEAEKLVNGIDPKEVRRQEQERARVALQARASVFTGVPHEAVKAMKVRWHFNCQDLGILDRTSGTFFIFRKGPL